MNNSYRTRIIAQGIALYAVVMDNPAIATTLSQRTSRDDWTVWQEDYPQFVEFVKREQFALFDRINAAF